MSCSTDEHLITSSNVSNSMQSPAITPVKSATNTNANQVTSKTTPVSKTAIVQAGTQLIITTISQTGQTQKVAPTQRVVSVAPVAINGASSSSIGSSSSSGSNTSNNSNTNGNINNNNNINTTTSIAASSSNPQINIVTASSSSLATPTSPSNATRTSSYQLQTYQNFNETNTYTNMTNAFYQAQNTTQTPNGFNQQATNDSDPQSTQATNGTPMYYVYPEQTFDMDNNHYQEIEGHVSHTAQASPITVQWLVDNFEPAEGCSLRRSSLYNFYIHHCNEQKIEPVNPASFGKLIRSVFLGLRTRRLGTRGNSKYHYYGIRLKATSPLNHLPEDHTFAVRHHPIGNGNISSGGGPSAKRAKQSHSFYDYDTKPSVSTVITTSTNTVVATPTPVVNSTTSATITTVSSGSSNGHAWSSTASDSSSSNSNGTSCQQVIHHQTNGQSTSNNLQNGQSIKVQADEEFDSIVKLSVNDSLKVSLPNLGTIKLENIVLSNNLSIDDVRKFEELYKDHCERILDLVFSLKFTFIDNIWQTFWRSPIKPDYNEYEEQLSTSKLIQICQQQEVLEFVRQCDNQFYQFCIESIIPNVLQIMPTNVSQQVRNFSKSAESWLRNALLQMPNEMQSIKISSIKALCMLLRRYTTLNHLSQAAINLLQNPQQIQQMLSDLSRVDFNNIQEQAGWICECDNQLVRRFEAEFKQNLQEQCSLDDWANWLTSVMDTATQKYEKTDVYATKIKNFLKNWGLYCEIVVRDLTLRSAPSFGSFHLVRLLYDEYMFYLAQQKIAKENGQTIVGLMSESQTFKTEY